MPTAREILEWEMRGCFDFFWNETNTHPSGYGLAPDRVTEPGSGNGDIGQDMARPSGLREGIASIAAVGFALTAYIVGVKRGYLSFGDGLTRVKGTLDTLLNRVPHYLGFMAHFVDMRTAERVRGTEYSTIDTAIALNGAVACAQFFQDSDVSRMVRALTERVDWQGLVYTENNKAFFRMAHDGNWPFRQNSVGFFGGWTMCAEQLMMYLLAAGGHFDEALARRLYLDFDRPYGTYGGHGCFYEPAGTLFVYQYSHAWFDFNRYLGCDGIDWHENSRQATLAQVKFCRDHPEIATFREGLWGVSACDGPDGYTVQGTPPCKTTPILVRAGEGFVPGEGRRLVDGTVAPCAIAGALPFTPSESEHGLVYLFEKHPRLKGRYGFKDAYNGERGWYADTYLGIDKGITLLMIANFLHRDVWDEYMSHPLIKNAVKKLGMTGKDGQQAE